MELGRFMKKNILMLFFIFSFAGTVIAQENFKVGDEVELNCNCFGRQEWVQGKIESISGNIIKVRYGNLKNQFQNVVSGSNLIRTKDQTIQNANDTELRNQFRTEAGKYLETVKFYAPFYDKNYKVFGLPAPQNLQKTMDQLAELDALCWAKYKNIRNFDRPWNKDTISLDNPQTWCLIAAKRNELEKPFRTEVAKTYSQSLLTITLDNLKKAIKDTKNRTVDETQILLFERDRWKAEMIAKAQAKFAEFGVEMPTDFLAQVELKADELLNLINQNAPNRNWEKPPYNDSAVESFIRGKYLADSDYKGVKVLKIGLDYATWKKYESLSYLGSDSNFRYYKVEYNEYKRGWSLIKLPNQPFCQAQEFIVGRNGGKIVLVSLGGSGIFMRCQ